MKNDLLRIDEIIKESAKGVLNIKSLYGDSLESIVKAMTIDKDKYEDCEGFELPNKYKDIYVQALNDNDRDRAVYILEKYGVKLPSDIAMKFSTALLLEYQGFNAMSQNIFDDIYARSLKAQMYPVIERIISSKAFSTRQKINASKPRNPHYMEAMRIATLTWKKYPCASKGAMCKKLRAHFNRQVSIDRLKDWIKEQGIQPPKPKAYTTFTLVTSEGA